MTYSKENDKFDLGVKGLKNNLVDSVDYVNWPLKRVSKADVSSHCPSICSDEGLMLGMAVANLYYQHS